MTGSRDDSSAAVPRAGVIGWPIKHSRSPLIHGHWLRRYGIAGSYEKVAVEPGDLAGFLAGLAAAGWRGCNVTVPHKEQALALADEATDTARAIGAANTLWVERGRLHATNTDAYGFMTHLRTEAPGWQEGGRPALVLGAGGAARAILQGLIEAGVREIRLVNRSRGRAEALVAHFGRAVVVGDWAERDSLIGDCGLLINTTSLGMTGQAPLDISLAAAGDRLTVSDIVYAPLETPLLKAARQKGLVAVDGLGMLLHQAVPGFERWFGIRPEVTRELRALIEADLRD
ncbi:MAG: shikimate dehydrogenase [Hyphomicrobiaceae bacterium]